MRTDCPTVISVWTRIHNDRIHKQKLRQIHQRASPKAATANYLKNLQRGSSQQERTRAQELATQNQKLFLKLNDLMDGRKSASSPFRQTIFAEPLGPKSLNYSAKKQEMQRIQQDNHRLARRLSEQQSSLRVKAFNELHKKNLKYKRQISRMARYKRLFSLEQKLSQTTGRRFCSSAEKEDLPQVQEEESAA